MQFDWITTLMVSLYITVLVTTMMQLILALYYKIKLLSNRTLLFLVTFVRIVIQIVLIFYTLAGNYDYVYPEKNLNYYYLFNISNLLVSIFDVGRCSIIVNLTGNLAFRTTWKERYQKLSFGYFFFLIIVIIGLYIAVFIKSTFVDIFIIITLCVNGISYLFEIITLYYILKRSRTEKGVVGSTLKRMAVLLSIATLASLVQFLYMDTILILRSAIPNNNTAISCTIILLDIVPIAVILFTFYRIPPTRKSGVTVRGTEMLKPLIEDPENPTNLIPTKSPITKKVGINEISKENKGIKEKSEKKGEKKIETFN